MTLKRQPSQAPFAILPWEIATDTRLAARDFRVLIALLSFRARDTGTFWATRVQISERCGIAENHISDVTRRLEKFGWLTKEGRGRETTRYRFIALDSTVPNPGPSQIRDRPKSEAQPSQIGDSTVPIRGHSDTHTDTHTEKKIKTRARRAPAEADLFPSVPDDVVDDFKKLRRAKRAPITKTAIDGIKREADKAGVTLAQALEVCCERGWAGFKAEWVANAHGSPTNGKPKIAQNFSAKTYQGTPDDELPSHLRD